MLTADNFVAAARSYVGVPWRHQGRSRLGIDCVGLLVCAARDCGLEVEDVTAYERVPDGRSLIRLLRRHCAPAAFADLAAGDIALMGRPATHVGILTGGYPPFGLIHVPTNGSCVEVRFDAAIHGLRGLYRPPTADS
jgi:cell wall-associated NlpC family hydrolase